MTMMNHLKTVFLLSGLLALCMWVGHWVGGPQGVLLGLLFGGVGNLVAFFFSDKIALTAMGAQPAPIEHFRWLHDMVERLAHRAGIPKPRVYICPQMAPNAFATGRSPRHSAVAITAGMLDGFSRAEIEGVMAHEVAHIKHRDVLITTMAAILAGIISYAGYSLTFLGGGNRDQNPLSAAGALAMILLAPIAALLIQMAVSRSREYAADDYGGQLCGDPRHLARALQRLHAINRRVPTEVNPAMNSLFIVQPLSGGGLMSWFSTHPPLEKRIARLMQQSETDWDSMRRVA